jgi:hypothetical protein
VKYFYDYFTTLKRILLSKIHIAGTALADVRDNAIIADYRPSYEAMAFSASYIARFIKMLIDAAK